ncbi:PAS domain S-box protein [Mesorhizobium sp. DCY119]|nr:PAS domain S-box protein [Mesorhizobium sp. DCY119]
MNPRWRISRILGCVLSVISWLISASVAIGVEPKSEVVVLFSSDTGLPATEAIRRGFRAVLHPNDDNGPDLYEEYLDAARFPGPAHLKAMASLLEAKYSGRPVDVVVALGPTALEFARQRKEKLFPGAKLVFAGIREERAGKLILPPDSFGIVSKLDPVETLKLALDLQPKARQGFIITGSASFDKSWEAIARTKLASFEPRLSLTFLAGLPLESVLERVSALPPDSIVIHLSMFEDGTGRTFVPREVAGKIASAANAPVYSVYDTYIGQGIVGGYMDTFDAVGLAVGSLVQKILAGEQPTGGAIREAETHKFVVDWRQMARWTLNAANLPQGTEIRFREPSVWDQYKSYILAFTAVLLLQSALLILGEIRSRKLAGQLAGESKERMEMAVTSADIGLWNWNAKSDTVWTSERCKELLMLDGRASLTRDEFIDRLRAPDRPLALKRMADALASGVPCIAEYPIDLPDGSERWILSRALAKGGYKDKGPRDHILGVVMDITERKRNEDAIRESEERYRVLAETASDAIITIDRKSVILFANPAAEKIFGHAVSEMLGNDLTMLMPDYLRRVHQVSVDRYLGNGERHISWEGVELPGLHKDGSLIPLELSFAEYISDGERRFTGIVRNVSDRKRAEEELRESEERYRNVVETQSELICRYRPDTTLTFVNDAYCRYFNRSRRDLVGAKWVDLIPQPARAAVLRHMKSIIAHAHTVSYEHEVQRPDGTVGWQHWTDRVILDADGGVVEIQGVGRDLTELRQAESEAVRHRQELAHLTRVSVVGALSGALAHELNQPLTAILSNAQAAVRLISRDPVDAVEIGQILQDIVDDDKRAGHVIQHLRSLLKKDSAIRTRIQVNDLITVSLAICHSDLILKGVPVSQRLAADLPEIDADPVQIQQVLLNLIMNACEAMNGKPAKDRLLLIKSERRDALLRISVVDSGDGIPAEAIKELYQPFFTTKSLGLGLGLPICKWIIEAHGGRLAAKNNSGGGATFFIELPIAEEQRHDRPVSDSVFG